MMVWSRVADSAEDSVLDPESHRWLPDALDTPSSSMYRFFGGAAVLVALVVPVGLEICAALSISPRGYRVLGPLLVGPGPASGPDSSADLPLSASHLLGLGLGSHLWHLLLVFWEGIDLEIEELVEYQGIRLGDHRSCDRGLSRDHRLGLVVEVGKLNKTHWFGFLEFPETTMVGVS